MLGVSKQHSMFRNRRSWITFFCDIKFNINVPFLSTGTFVQNRTNRFWLTSALRSSVSISHSLSASTWLCGVLVASCLESSFFFSAFPLSLGWVSRRPAFILFVLNPGSTTSWKRQLWSHGVRNSNFVKTKGSRLETRVVSWK